MPFITITPQQIVNEQEIRFVTFQKYLHAFVRLLRQDYYDVTSKRWEIDSLKTASQLLGEYQNPSHSTKEVRDICSLLKNAVATEKLLASHMANRFEFIEQSNQWLPVMAYYATYQRMRAYIIAMHETSHSEHDKTISKMSEIACRHKLLPFPWNIGYGKAETGKNYAQRFCNIRAGMTVNRVSNLSVLRQNDALDFYGKFLKTTRDEFIRLKCERWREQNKKKRARKGLSSKYDETLQTTSIFNCLYRLRIRSNYRDADMFIEGQTEQSAYLFAGSLRIIVWLTGVVLSTQILSFLSETNRAVVEEELGRLQTTRERT